jgi:pimeloyl-ACP methyl ester carboxylesterase
MTITTREQNEITAANDSGAQPVVFVHGLWLLAESWDAWKARFADEGYAPVAVDWPDDPATVDAALDDPSAFAGKGVLEVADHIEEVVRALDRKPIVIGHSFGGLLTQITAGRGLALAAVAIDPAPFKGVLPLPFSSLKGAFPVLKNPANRTKAVRLTFDEFRFGFANAVSEEEAKDLYDGHHVAAPGRPLFQAATANVNPRSATRVDTRQADRGPLLIVSGGEDNIVPWSMANAAYKIQAKRNPHPTEIVEIPGVGHSLVIDSHWTEVADAALGFLRRHGLSA